MKVIPVTEIEGAKLLKLERRIDGRGWFVELSRREWFTRQPPVQINVSLSRRGVIRGLHYHLRGQDDLFCVLQGVARVVLFDRREDSPTAGRSWSYDLDAGRHDRLDAVYVPGETAHGYQALTDDVLFLYHVTREYDLDDPDEHEFPWDDPRVVHLWAPELIPVLSARDAG